MTEQERPRVWDRYVPEDERRLCREAGYGARQGFGKRPAVLVVDATVGMVGDARLPILESIERWSDSCGEAGWDAVERTRSLLERARAAGVPVIYTRPHEPQDAGVGPAVGLGKNSRWSEPGRRAGANDIASAIAPVEGDVVITKAKASGFIATYLLPLLVQLQVDSLIVTGGSTSGCVRATAVDAASYNYRVSVVEDCTFDRIPASHAVNLFDLNLKYADVVSLDEALAYVEGIADGPVERTSGPWRASGDSAPA